MREISFDLKKYKGISGELILEVPGYRERLRIMKECNLQVNDKGNATLNTGAIDNLINVLDVTEKYFKKINIKYGEITAKTFSELEDYPEFVDLINDAAGFILHAGKLGK